MPQPPRLYVHVGLQKTGTSYLQGVALRNVDQLARQGLDLVPATKRGAFELMLQVRGRYNPDRDPASTATALERFSRDLAAAPGSRALVSQESLAAARTAQVRRFLEACGDREVHLVVTVRDLGRQLPSMWQQEVKSGRTDTYRQFLRRLRSAQRSGRTGHPWIHLDPPAVLARWGAELPSERIHVVTVPPSGSSPTLLLERFCRVLDLDPSQLLPDEGRGNTSLGRVQVELLRRVNAELPEPLRRRQVYGDIGKRWFAARVLATQAGQPIRVPAGFRSWCEEVTEAQVAALRAAPYRIEGDLADLRCQESAFAPDADKPAEREVATAAVAALVTVLQERARGAGRRRGGPGGRDGAGGARTVRGRLGGARRRIRRAFDRTS